MEYKSGQVLWIGLAALMDTIKHVKFDIGCLSYVLAIQYDNFKKT